MSKDKACISAVKEVCQRCPLYKENCGMFDFPDKCSTSGRYIDGYRQAEKDVAESFARIIRGNLSMIGKSVQDKFEELYTDVTGEKMYKGFKD